MEKIKMIYTFDEDEENSKIVMETSKSALDSSEVCQLFEDFMNAIGFDFDQIAKYFN